MSASLDNYRLGAAEIGHLLRVLPKRRRGISADPDVDKAIVRACIVLLTSHLEAYLKSINEEAIGYVNELGLTGDQVPLALRLKHSAEVIDSLAAMQWGNREDALKQFVNSDACLWSNGAAQFEAKRLTSGFKTPNPKWIKVYFERWGMPDVFSKITRSRAKRSHLWFSIQSLADKRNNIAHGDASETATPSDVRRYRDAVTIVVDRLDRMFSSLIGMEFGCPRPW